MIVAFDPDEIREYYLINDIDKKVKFLLGVLDPYQYNHIRNIIRHNDINWTAEAVRLGLKGWSGLKSKKGIDLIFETEKTIIAGIGEVNVVTKRCMGYIKHYIDELGLKIINDNELTGEESKNSDMP